MSRYPLTFAPQCYKRDLVAYRTFQKIIQWGDTLHCRRSGLRTQNSTDCPIQHASVWA